MSWSGRGATNRAGGSPPGPQFGVPRLVSFSGTVPASPFSQCPANVSWPGLRIPCASAYPDASASNPMGILETPVFYIKRVPTGSTRPDAGAVSEQHPQENRCSRPSRGWPSRAVLISHRSHRSPTGAHRNAAGVAHFRLTSGAGVAIRRSFVSILVCGHLSHNIGSANMYRTAGRVTGVFGFVYFTLCEHRSERASSRHHLSLNPRMTFRSGPQAAAIAEALPGRLRTAGSSLG